MDFIELSLQKIGGGLLDLNFDWLPKDGFEFKVLVVALCAPFACVRGFCSLSSSNLFLSIKLNCCALFLLGLPVIFGMFHVAVLRPEAGLLVGFLN